MPEPRTEAQVQAQLAKPNYARGGYYIGFEGFAAIENSAVIAGNSFVVSGGLDIRLGARHNRWFATEISGIYVHTYGDGTGQFLAWGMSVNERFYFTRGRIQPFLTAGAGFIQPRARSGAFINDGNQIDLSPGFSPGFAPLFGAGMEIYATENVAVTLMANYYLTVGNISGFDFVVAGMGLQFF